MAVKLTPLGALSLTSRAARKMSAHVAESRLVFSTCGGVVEVLVDELDKRKLAIASFQSSRWITQTYVVRCLGDIAERRRWELGNDLLDLDVFSHDE